MRLTGIFLTVTCLQVSAGAFSQNINISRKNVSLSKVFSAIQEQSGYLFFYNNVIVRQAGNTDVGLKNATIQQALDQALKGKPLTYTIVDKYIVISRSAGASPAPPGQSADTTIRVNGRVTNAAGVSLVGVVVRVKGSDVGVSTDDKGEFSLQAPRDAVLVLSYIGYKVLEVPVDGRSIMNVSLAPSTTGLNQLVVVGYGTTEKKDLTSAITSVNTKLLNDRSLTDLSSALEGITPGVFIQQQNGRPGQSGASSFNIRGASLSTFSKNPPLVIIDGVVDNIDDVNPANVASISILKDAAASAIYGARATGGVVLITTKKGAPGKISVTYNGTYGLQRQPYGNLKFLNTATWMKANNEAAELDGSPDVFTSAQIAQYTNSKNPQYPASSQWLDWISKTAPQSTNDISIRGGGKQVSVFLSGGLLKQGGFIPNDNYSRKNVLLNLDYHPNKRLAISTNFAYIRDEQVQPGTGYNGGVFGMVRNAIFTPPNIPLHNPNGTFTSAFWGDNPVFESQQPSDEISTSDNFRMSLSVKYEILKDLDINIITAAKLQYTVNNTLVAKEPLYDPNGNISAYNVSNTAVSEDWSRYDYVNNQFLLNYKKSIGLHDFRIMGGITYEDEYDKYIGASASQFPNNEIREIAGTTGSGSQISGTSNASEWAINSVIGRFNYNYNDKYLFQATARYDGSSRFSPDRQWGFFPSFSAGWRISQEPFLKNATFISDLKLRASWGQLGNEGASLYPFAQTVSTSGTRVFGNGIVSTASLGGPVNLALTWEKQTSENIGLDFGFLSNRLSGSFDHFKERTYNIIGTPPVPSTFGTSAPLSNLYTIDTRGFELAIHWNDQIGSFKYFAGFNLSNSVDKVVNLAGLGTTDNTAVFGKEPVVISGDTYMQRGKAQNQWYLLKTDGLFVSQAQIDKSAKQTTLTRPGDIHYVDANGDGVINSDDTRPLGKTSTPHYYFGANIGGAFKNFDLSVVINGVWERWNLKNAGGAYLSGVRPDLNLLQVNYDHRWTTKHPDQWAKEPRLSADNWIGNLSNLGQNSEFQLVNFGYLRVKNIQLGYTLPEKITKKLSITRARIYISTENLFTYKPGYVELIDPESLDGYDPQASVFFGPDKLTSVGIDVTF